MMRTSSPSPTVAASPRVLSRAASICAPALLGLLISACSSAAFFTQTPVPPSELAPYTLELEVRGTPRADADGYEVVLGFDLRSRGEFAYNAIVQEIVQETDYTTIQGKHIRETLTLVEAFETSRVGPDDDGLIRYRLKPFQRDRHIEHGYTRLEPTIARVEVCRVVRYYPAFVRDADWSLQGFAHLPRNREGSLFTEIPRNFNERHQRNYLIDGEIVQDDRGNAHWYSMRYSWRRSAAGIPQADFVFRRDGRPPDESLWVSRMVETGMRMAGAGE